jgi:hypothetical protein
MEKDKKEKDMTIGELAIMMRDSFQGNQDYMDKKFDAIDRKFEQVDRNFKQINENFKEVYKKIDNISLNAVDTVKKEEFDKLETRVSDIEEVVELKLKEA